MAGLPYKRRREDLWRELDGLEGPTDGGRRLDVCGFVLADPFEVILRRISSPYLTAAWARVAGGLVRCRLEIPDLSWGWMHWGETGIPGALPHAPSDYTGWTSRKLAAWTNREWTSIYEDSQLGPLDRELSEGHPALRVAATWRSRKWAIAPGAIPQALKLVEALWCDEGSDWHPRCVLADHEGCGGEPWLLVARAIDAADQRRLDEALEQARLQYSPLGYRIMRQGFALLLELSGSYAGLSLGPSEG